MRLFLLIFFILYGSMHLYVFLKAKAAFTFSIITGLYYPTQAGLAKLSSNSQLYVSRGSGTWGPPIRFLSLPEITVIDLIHENE